MKNNVKYYFDSSRGIFHKNYTGEIQLSDIFNSWNHVIENKVVPVGAKKFVINYKNAQIVFPPEDVVNIAAFYKTHDDIFAKSRIAMIMETPEQTVFPHLLQMEKINFSIMTFYTLEAALDWLS